jgi:rhomboid protease GluP
MQNFFKGGPSKGPGFGMSFPGAGRPSNLTYGLIAINVVMVIAMEIAGGSQDTGTLVDFGAMYGPEIADGDYWRLFTAMFLHVGFIHLAFNAFGLFIFGRLVESVFGPFRFALLYVLSGLFGSLTSYLINSDVIAAGASGAVFGIIGVMAAYFAAQRSVMGKTAQQNLYGLLALAAINVFFGLLMPGIDNWAHLGGFAAGFGLGYALTPSYDVVRSLTGQPMGFTERPGGQTKGLGVAALAIVVLVLGVWAGTASLPTSAAAHVRDAEQLFDQGDFEAALTEIDSAFDVGSGPSRALGRAYFLRGLIRDASGDVEGAKTDLGQAVGLGDERTSRSANELLVQINSDS